MKHNLLKTNEEIYETLLRKANMPIIESLLENEAKELKRTRILTTEEPLIDLAEGNRAETLLSTVQMLVKDILPTEGIGLPAIALGTFKSNEGCRFTASSPMEAKYIEDYKTILLPKTEKLSNLINATAHEYAHHIQFELLPRLFQDLDPFIRLGLLLEELRTFEEGHAVAVAKIASKKYAKSVDKSNAICSFIDTWSVPELRSCYIWACEKLAHRKDGTLLEPIAAGDDFETNWRKRHGAPTPHAMGYTFCCIYETLYGDKIYKECLK